MRDMLNDPRVLEIKKTQLRDKVNFHKKNVILQSVFATILVIGGIYAGQRKSILVPLVFAPSAENSISKLGHHESQRRQYKEQLKNLERN